MACEVNFVGRFVLLETNKEALPMGRALLHLLAEFIDFLIQRKN